MKRTELHPYRLSKWEFFENDMGFLSYRQWALYRGGDFKLKFSFVSDYRPTYKGELPKIFVERGRMKKHKSPFDKMIERRRKKALAVLK